MSDAPGGEKTEKATPRRREKALEQGQVALSQEVNSILVLLAGFSLIFITAGFIATQLNDNARYLFSQAHTLLISSPHTLSSMTSANVWMILKAIAPFLGVIMFSGIVANILQVGWHVNPSAMAFRVDNINPIKGAKSIFSKKSLFEMLKNILKIGVISLVAWLTIRGLDLDVMATALLSLDGVTSVGKSAMMQLVYKLVAVLAVIAVADWIFQKHQYEENIKMTKQELKEEYKDMEGDPQIKARIRAIQYEMARKRMLADVPTADVVITNPTHFAVAIKYTAGDAAPIVVAKGKDEVAQKIKKIARNAKVPVIENKPLARGLHKAVKIGEMIPDEFFKAVAEVLAYIYRLRKA
jgi:flagellar biosynthesis protein FlhB